MMEKVKKFFAGLASITAFLYATGYIAEYAHARMLGIPMGQPLNEYYLISGGSFLLSTLYALYSTIFSHFYLFIAAFLIIGAFIYYEAYTKEKNVMKISKTYVLVISLLTFKLAS